MTNKSVKFYYIDFLFVLVIFALLDILGHSLQTEKITKIQNHSIVAEGGHHNPQSGVFVSQSSVTWGEDE